VRLTDVLCALPVTVSFANGFLLRKAYGVAACKQLDSNTARGAHPGQRKAQQKTDGPFAGWAREQPGVLARLLLMSAL